MSNISLSINSHFRNFVAGECPRGNMAIKKPKLYSSLWKCFDALHVDAFPFIGYVGRRALQGGDSFDTVTRKSNMQCQQRIELRLKQMGFDRTLILAVGKV